MAEGEQVDERVSKFEYDVFVSYSRRDRTRVAAVVERLEAAGLRVFWDKHIQSGALWLPALTTSLKASQCVLVLWSKDAKTRPWVLSEASLALELKVLQQVLLEPVGLDMPFDAVQLLGDLSTWKPGEPHEALEELVQKLLAVLATPLASLEKQLADERLRQIRRKRQRRQALRVAAPVALLLGMLLGSGVMDAVFGFETRIRLISVWARGALTAQRLHDDITFVRIDKSTKGSRGNEYYKTWRSDLALAIEHLAAQGAGVIALDVTFKATDDRDGTRKLAGAIAAARAPKSAQPGGTAVIVGAKDWDQAGGGPVVAPEISQALRGPAGAPGYVGITCGGMEGGYATTFPVLVSKGTLATKPSKNLLPSLAFAAAMAKWEEKTFEWNVDADRVSFKGPNAFVPLSGWDQAARTANTCPIVEKGDFVAKLIVEQSPAQSPWRHELAFDEVVKSASGLEDKVRDRICLVGDADELHKVWSAGPAEVPGVKLHADALSTLLRATALRRLPPVSQLFLMLALGTVAALTRFAISPARRSARLAVLAGLIAADLLLTVIGAAYVGLFVDAGYHVLAILVSYWYAERIEGRFFALPATATSGVPA